MVLQTRKAPHVGTTELGFELCSAGDIAGLSRFAALLKTADLDEIVRLGVAARHDHDRACGGIDQLHPMPKCRAKRNRMGPLLKAEYLSRMKCGYCITEISRRTGIPS